MYARRLLGAAVALLLGAAPARAQHAGDMLIGSTVPGGGALAIRYDFANAVIATPSFSFGGTTIYSATDPGFDALRQDDPGEPLHVLGSGTQVTVELTAAAPGASLRVRGTTLDAPGESAVLGTFTTADPEALHHHPVWSLALPTGTTGEAAVSFRLTTSSSAYTASETYTATVRAVIPTPTPTATPTASPTPPPAATATPTGATSTPTATMTTTPPPAATATATASPTTPPTPDAPPDLVPYAVYKAAPSKLPGLADKNRLPKGWNLTLDDAMLDAATGDPESYTVGKAGGLALPAVAGGTPPGPGGDTAGASAGESRGTRPVDAGAGESRGTAPAGAVPHYVHYAIVEAAQGIGPALPNGKLPKTVRAPKRLWHVENELGDLVLETGRARALWVPAGAAGAPATPDDPGDRTHLVCYQAKAAPVPSAQAPDERGNGKARFRRDLQHHLADHFEDCARLKDGTGAPFPGTPVEGACLYDLRRPRELCNPVDTRAVEPPRATTAELDESTATIRDLSLLCYQAALATRVRSAAAATLGGGEVGDKLGQRPHVPRRLRDGTQINVHPGNRFPRPLAVDTAKAELVCLPARVLAVSER
jgi:hypothetical protein